MNIIWGLIILAFGVLMTIKAQSMAGIFGQVAWAEANLRGGSAAFFKLLGIVVALVGILIATNLVQGLLIRFLAPLF